MLSFTCEGQRAAAHRRESDRPTPVPRQSSQFWGDRPHRLRPA